MTIAAAAYPLDFHDSFDSYAAKVTAWVSEAAASGAALLVFPEYGAMELGSLGGRAVAGDLEACLHEVARWKPQVDALHCALAARFGVHILGASGPVFLSEKGNDIYTSAGQTDPKRNAVYTSGPRPVNRATLYGPGGILGHQDKQIMTRFERETWFVEPGHGLRVFDTPLGRLGVVTCYDSEFPLLSRALVEAGAEILLAPSCTDSLRGFTRVRVGSMARALENQCVVVHAPTVGLCDFCPAVDENVGSAAIYGPPDLGFPETGIFAETPLNQPGWAIATVDRAAIAEVRRAGGVLNHLHWEEQAARIAAGVAVV
ncbi:MAG: carbon-nitrogen hydrolase family protein [Gemmobacter sp.]|uniref:carbon-nitrogen hydrolase family protein n=1 Tax=Gemmobacter sp. TaxID=1898957 RepID=UPI001A49EE03|nr:carbon-nitrogen hydrolase family protein [Gemmobacter sp.]MBL8563406.1 carbon-nitrogen hydrolase family protein [Gemmobacter sp.]